MVWVEFLMIHQVVRFRDESRRTLACFFFGVFLSESELAVLRVIQMNFGVG